MDMMKPKPSDSPQSPDKTRLKLESQPSDQISAFDDSPSWSTRTPKKVPNLPQNIKYHRHAQLPEKYEMLLKFFDALDASLKLLRLRKSVPTLTKIRAMIEKMSERRFTHQHLAQLKFLLPKEMGVKRVLMPDEETRCMKYDLHVSFNIGTVINTKKRKRGNNNSCLRDRFLSRLLQFLRAHPEGTEMPEEELPEPFNRHEQDLLLNTTKHSSSFSHVQNFSDVTEDLQPAQASHFSSSFKKHFSKGIKSGNNCHSPLNSLLQSPPISVSKPSVSEDGFRQAVPCNQHAVQGKQKSFTDDKTCCARIKKKKATTPAKSIGTPILMAATPALQTPKRCSMSPDDHFSSSPNKAVDRPSCARSLRFDDPLRNANIELQVDEAEYSNIIDILPANLLQSLKEKEKRKTEQSNRKLLMAGLPKLFDRIYYLFQSPKSSLVRKEAVIRDLTERHSEITDESKCAIFEFRKHYLKPIVNGNVNALTRTTFTGEVEEQLKLLQEIIPEWISHKLSPSGNILYSINRELNPNTLRLRLDKAM